MNIYEIIDGLNTIGKNLILSEYPITSLEGNVVIVVKDIISPRDWKEIDNLRYNYLILTNYWGHIDIIRYSNYLRKVVRDYLDGKADRDMLENAYLMVEKK